MCVCVGGCFPKRSSGGPQSWRRLASSQIHQGALILKLVEHSIVEPNRQVSDKRNTKGTIQLWRTLLEKNYKFESKV